VKWGHASTVIQQIQGECSTIDSKRDWKIAWPSQIGEVKPLFWSMWSTVYSTDSLTNKYCEGYDTLS